MNTGTPDSQHPDEAETSNPSVQPDWQGGPLVRATGNQNGNQAQRSGRLPFVVILLQLASFVLLNLTVEGTSDISIGFMGLSLVLAIWAVDLNVLSFVRRTRKRISTTLLTVSILVGEGLFLFGSFLYWNR